MPNIFNSSVSFRRGHLIFWPVFVLTLVLDLWSKSAVFEWLSGRGIGFYDIINGLFRFVLVENRGAAWGIASGRKVELIAVSVIALAAVFCVFLFSRRNSAVVIFSLALFASGICGNLYDRLFNDGRVRDFLDFYWHGHHFPAFNIADSALTVAVCFLIISTFFQHSDKPEKME